VSLRYHELQRLGASGGWRPFVGLLLLVGGFLTLQGVALGVIGLWLLLTGQAVVPGLESALDVDHVTPLLLAYVNIALGLGVPLALVISRALHRLSFGWLVSVARGVRWRYLGACFGLSVLALLATLVVASFLPADAGTGMSTEPNDFTRTTRDFLLVVLLLTPLQAAGEEFVFRGYLVQAFGGIFATLFRGARGADVFAVGLSSVLFALAHGLGQGWPIFIDRLAFGIVAGVLVVLTGGLEAGIAMHVVNNFVAFALALSFGDMTSALNASGGSWWMLPTTLTQSLAYLALAVWTARRMGLANRVEPPLQEGVLDRPPGRV